jgi:hypothetical protein
MNVNIYVYIFIYVQIKKPNQEHCHNIIANS